MIICRIPAEALSPGDPIAEGEVLDVIREDGFVRVVTDNPLWREVEFPLDLEVGIFA